MIFIVVPWLYLGNSQVSVYRTIGPTLVRITDHLDLTSAVLSPNVKEEIKQIILCSGRQIVATSADLDQD